MEKEGEEGVEAKDPPVKFNPRLDTVVNGSFIRIDCGKNGKNETYFLHLPFRPKRLAAIKDEKRKSILIRDKSDIELSNEPTQKTKIKCKFFFRFSSGL